MSHKIIPLGKISDLITSGSRGWAEYYSESGALFLRMTNLPKNGIQLLLHDNKYVSVPEGANEGKRTSVRTGDVLISITAELGKIGYVENTFIGEAYVNQHICLVRIKPDAANSKFIAYYLSAQKQRNLLNSFNDSSAKSGLNLSTINNFPISLPNITTQNYIVDILSVWDKAIVKMQSLIAAKERQFGWLEKKLINSNNPSKIKKIKLGDIAKISSGGTPSSSVSAYYDGDIPWVSIADMTEHGKWISRTKRNITNLGLDKSAAKIYPQNTVLYAMYASIGECSIAGVDLASSQAILGIIPTEVLHYEYLYYYLRSLKEKIKLQGQHGTQANLNAGMVRNFELSLPSTERQKTISSELNIAQKEINTLKQLVEKYHQQKTGLMQKLLTREWCIKNREVEPA